MQSISPIFHPLETGRGKSVQSITKCNIRVVFAEKVEFLSWSCIDLVLYGSYSFVGDAAEVSAFGDVLSDEFVDILDSPFLPYAVCVGEEDGHTEALCDPFAFGKLAAVIGCYALEDVLVWQQHPPHCLCYRLCLLAMWKLLHHQEIGAALHKHEDGMGVLIHNEVHLEVSEACAIGLYRTLVDAHTMYCSNDCR